MSCLNTEFRLPLHGFARNFLDSFIQVIQFYHTGVARYFVSRPTFILEKKKIRDWKYWPEKEILFFFRSKTSFKKRIRWYVKIKMQSSEVNLIGVYYIARISRGMLMLMISDIFFLKKLQTRWTGCTGKSKKHGINHLWNLDSIYISN